VRREQDAAVADDPHRPAVVGERFADALGEQIFVSGTPGGALSCGSCHTMRAAGTSGTTGPNLDKELTSDPPAPTRESIVNPNKEIVARTAIERVVAAAALQRVVARQAVDRVVALGADCLLYPSPSPPDSLASRIPFFACKKK